MGSKPRHLLHVLEALGSSPAAHDQACCLEFQFQQLQTLREPGLNPRPHTSRQSFLGIGDSTWVPVLVKQGS